VLNCIAPGKIEDTRMALITDRQVRDLRGWTKEEANAYALRNVPARRFTTTKEVVEAMFGILTMPSYVNGACIDMTGGA
jgi:NAD(P)-dependent dehydrogenase (short-subunit alcohol dehydrogenase family)